MKKYVLYANVNPLEPNALIKVADSSNYAMGAEECLKHFVKLAEELNQKNYLVSLKQVIEITMSDWRVKKGKESMENDPQNQLNP